MNSFSSGGSFGKYLIKQRLGSGGMSDVYLAIDNHSNQQVAIKILHNHLLRENEGSIRFQKEITAVKSLEHPGIVTIIDIGEIDGYEYYSMEYLSRGSLRQKIEAGIGFQESINIIIKLANALSYVHDQGYVHRDIKPENVIFNSDGDPVITDLGVVKSLLFDTRLTQTGTGVGTPYYMSPEQARGDAGLDGRSDIYSLGILFYEMLIGDVPYDGDSAVSIVMRHVEAPIPILPNYLSTFQPVINKMIAKRQEDRYSGCQELIADLKRLLQVENYAGETNSQQATTCVNIPAVGTEKPKKYYQGAVLIVAVLIVISIYFLLINDSKNAASGILLKEKHVLKENLPLKESIVLRQNQGIKEVSNSHDSRTSNSEQKVVAKQQSAEKVKSAALAEVVPQAQSSNANMAQIQSKGSPILKGPPILRIETKPSGAEIVINGRPFGRTPYYGREIASGVHELILKFEGYEDYSTELELKQAQLTEKRIDLVKARGQLFLKTIPAGATIILNGKDTGQVTPYKFDNIEAGKHQIEFRMPKYYTYAADITVAGGGNGDLIAELKGGDFVEYQGEWITPSQQISSMLQQADKYANSESPEGIDNALVLYRQVLRIKPGNINAADGLKKIAEKQYQYATYYCDEEVFNQCFAYLKKTLSINPQISGAKELLTDSITRLAWENILAGNSPSYHEAVAEITVQYKLNTFDITQSQSGYEARVQEIEKHISNGNWKMALDELVWLESKVGMSDVAKELRNKYQALKDCFQTGKIVRDRLKDGTLGPRLVVVPFKKSIAGQSGNKRLYLVSETEISNRQYSKFLLAKGESVEDQSRPDYPVVQITYEHAKAYVSWLSNETGENYRLPSANELMFAFNAGERIGKKPKTLCAPFLNFEDVSSGAKNSFGLIGYDRNIWEITSTCVDNNCTKVYLMGGAVDNKEVVDTGFETVSYCISNSSVMKSFDINSKNISTGFRVLREML